MLRSGACETNRPFLERVRDFKALFDLPIAVALLDQSGTGGYAGCLDWVHERAIDWSG
jgi:hypothetical protein